MDMGRSSNFEQGQSKAVETNSVQSGRRMTLDEQNVAMELDQKWFLYTMGEFTVTALCKVRVEITGRVSYWCGGISWDYAELKPLN